MYFFSFMSRFLVDPLQDGVEDVVLQVADYVGEEPLAEHVHSALQQVLPLEGVGRLRSLHPRLKMALSGTYQSLQFPTCFFWPSSISDLSGSSLMMSLEVCRETLQTSDSSACRHRHSRLETSFRIITGLLIFL